MSQSTVNHAQPAANEPQTLQGRIVRAIKSAAKATGISFDYLLNTANRESGMNPKAKAPTSSATGLYQFIDQTWLGMVQKEGANIGLTEQAQMIERTSSGRLVVNDPQARREILSLRKDPEIASHMAAAFTQENSEYLEKNLGRTPTKGELYIAHFMGARGALSLIEGKELAPQGIAARQFPEHAEANRTIFYKKSGAPRTNSEVYEVLAQKGEPSGEFMQLASRRAGQHMPSELQAQEIASWHDKHMGSRFAVSDKTRSPMHDLFLGRTKSPINNRIASLWTGLAADKMAVEGVKQSSGPLDLSRFHHALVRSKG